MPLLVLLLLLKELSCGGGGGLMRAWRRSSIRLECHPFLQCAHAIRSCSMLQQLVMTGHIGEVHRIVSFVLLLMLSLGEALSLVVRARREAHGEGTELRSALRGGCMRRRGG